MTRRLVSAATFAMALTLASSAGSQAGVCTSDRADAADKSIDTLSSWAKVYAGYQHFRDCQDGAIAEGYDDRIVALLVGKWETTPALAKLSEMDPAFERFVLDHLDTLMSPDQAKEIIRNATTRCPNGASVLCLRLARKAAAPN